MSRNKYVKHKNIVTENNNGDKVEVFYHKHYDSEGYKVTKVNNVKFDSSGAWETLENAVKSTEKRNL